MFWVSRCYLAVVIACLAMQPSALAATPRCDAPPQAGAIPITLSALPASPWPHHSVLGANILYTVDDLATWKAGLPSELRRLGIGSLRFPGGEVADGYDWEHAGPEDNSGSGSNSVAIDYKLFLGYAKVANVDDIYFVVNVEGAYRAPGDRETNLLRYADKAARWVTAVKDSGYRVRHWEIGNESYHVGTTYPLTAAEYAHALTVFSRAMRQADPTIRIIANGPHEISGVSFADRLTEEQLALFRNPSEKLCGQKARKGCRKAIQAELPGSRPAARWWQVLAQQAPEAFDAITIHTYSMVDLNLPARYGFLETNKIAILRNSLSKLLGRPIDVAVTEWNVQPERRGGRMGPDAVVSNAVKLGNFLAAGVSDATFWPLRSKGSLERALLSMQPLTETPMYRGLHLVNTSMTGQFVSQNLVANGLYLLQTRSPDADNLMLVNGSPSAVTVTLSPPAQGIQIEVNQVAGESMSGGLLCTGELAAKPAVIVLPALSITTARIKPSAFESSSPGWIPTDG